MKNLMITGLNENKVNGVVKGLNQLLADLHVYYMNLRGLHWNVQGKGFFQLHAEYEKQYNDTAEKIDSVAERLLQLDSKPENRFSELLKAASLQEENVRNVQLRIKPCQLLQRIFHGQDAANDGAALGIYVSFSTQHFGKTLEHAACYLLMLLGSA